MDYAIIRVGGKQYRVREGETLLVDRVRTEEGKTFSPDVLLGDGAAVTAKVLAHERGPKIRIGKYKRRTGYKRHTASARRLAHRDLAWRRPGAARRRPQPRRSRPPRPDAGSAPQRRAAEHEHVKGMPKGYEEMTVAQITDGAKTWNRPMLEAALAYEEAHAARKGAIAALNSALKAKEEEA